MKRKYVPMGYVVLMQSSGKWFPASREDELAEDEEDVLFLDVVEHGFTFFKTKKAADEIAAASRDYHTRQGHTYVGEFRVVTVHSFVPARRTK